MAPWLIWIAMAALAAAAAIPLLAPLCRGRRVSDGTGGHAAAIYRDQLDEVDRDVASGIVAEPEAGAARTEIARRLIRAGAETDAAAPKAGRGVAIAAAIVIAMPVAAFLLYLSLGSPEYPDQPIAARAPAAGSGDIATLIAAVESRLAAAPEDGRGWDVIAPVYLRLGRSTDAAAAYANAIRLLGSTTDREIGLGEALVNAGGGTIGPEARAAFERAGGLAPTDPRPRFYLALALQQEGRSDEALAAWRALLADAPEGAEWASAVETQIAALESPAAPGPSAEDVEAATDLAPADRQAMIEGMVASLAARLEDAPADPDGWARLVRSYMVLGRSDDARDALTRARAALAGDAGGLATVEAAARDAGMETTE